MTMEKGFSFHPVQGYLRLFAQRGELLECLLGLGVESLEFVVHAPRLSEELPLIERAKDIGCRITLHPRWEGVFDVTEFADEPTNRVLQNFEELFVTAGALADRQDYPVVIVVHGPTYPSETKESYELGIKTMAKFLHWAGDRAQRTGQRLRFGFENPPKKLGAKMGGSHANTLEIVERADHELVSITWDMGHSAFIVHIERLIYIRLGPFWRGSAMYTYTI
jgi:sugar phosphate isomerase/epimerase